MISLANKIRESILIETKLIKDANNEEIGDDSCRKLDHDNDMNPNIIEDNEAFKERI